MILFFKFAIITVAEEGRVVFYTLKQVYFVRLYCKSQGFCRRFFSFVNAVSNEGMKNDEKYRYGSGGGDGGRGDDGRGKFWVIIQWRRDLLIGLGNQRGSLD